MSATSLWASRISQMAQAGASAGLCHLGDDEAELAQRKEDVDQVEAELLPLAQRQRAADDLAPAEVEHGGLAQPGDEEDSREEEGERARDVELMRHQVVCSGLEARLLHRLADKRLDYTDA